MPTNNRRSGALRELVNIQAYIEVDDGYGGTKLEWSTVATAPAGFYATRGSESSMASRLAGKQPFIVTVRSSLATRAITPAYKLQDARRPERMFDIKAISDPDGKNAWLEMLAVETVT